MNTCSQCLEDYPADETTWREDNPGIITGSYWCDWCVINKKEGE